MIKKETNLFNNSYASGPSNIEIYQANKRKLPK